MLLILNKTFYQFKELKLICFNYLIIFFFVFGFNFRFKLGFEFENLVFMKEMDVF